MEYPADYHFIGKAFILLGIERFLYGYWFILPNRFKEAVKNGKFGSRLKAEPLYWKVAMRLGMYIKVFQYSVIIYDLLVRCQLTHPFASTDATSKASLGVICILIGQGLNYSVFRALGPIGVYYGHELGYTVPRVSCFPYNTGLSDPQYWGVVICVWGIYLTLGASSFAIPCLETFWYLTSMKLLENERGRSLAKTLGIKDSVSKEQ